jgi:hypothetical protein
MTMGEATPWWSLPARIIFLGCLFVQVPLWVALAANALGLF